MKRTDIKTTQLTIRFVCNIFQIFVEDRISFKDEF